MTNPVPTIDLPGLDKAIQKEKVWAICVVCGRPVCKVEHCPDHPHGVEVSDGWVCSSICWDYHTESTLELQVHLQRGKSGD